MVYQGHLFDKAVMVERTLSTGTVLRLKLEPLGEGKVRVLEYHRKGFLHERFKRQKDEEGKVFVFADLGLSQSYHALFS